MEPLVLMFPVKHGMREKLKEFARVLREERQEEFDHAQKRIRVSKEGWFLQETPRGDFVVVYAEAEDPAVAIRALVASRDPVDLWLKAQVAEITGIDFNQPPAMAPFQPILQYGYRST